MTKSLLFFSGVSLVWHVAWISLIDVRLESGTLATANYPRVSFLGSVLPETAFRYAESEFPTPRFKIKRGLSQKRIMGYDTVVRHGPFPYQLHEEITAGKNELEPVPGKEERHVRLPETVEWAAYATPQPQIEGNLSGRWLLAGKLDAVAAGLPADSAPEAAARMRHGKHVKILLCVGPEGDVISAVPLVKSGVSWLDEAAVRRVKEWVFAPSDNNETSCGEVTIEVKTG